MGQLERQEREPSGLLTRGGRIRDAGLAVITLERSALPDCGAAPQVGDLVVVTIDGANRAVIIFQLDPDHAVVVDVT